MVITLRLSVIKGVPRVRTLHILPCAPCPVCPHFLVIPVPSAVHPLPHLGVAAQSGVSSRDHPRAGVTLGSPGLVTPAGSPPAVIRPTLHTRTIGTGITRGEGGDVNV